MKEVDVFFRLIREFGPPQNAQRVPPEIADEFYGRVPKEVIEFWKSYGWGEYKEGYFRVCDPRIFDPLMKIIFDGDEELHAEDIITLGYTAFNTLRIWNRKSGAYTLIFLEKSEISGNKAVLNPDTGKKYSESFLSGLLFYDQLVLKTPDYYEEVCDKLGRPGADEVFGYAPALQLGGEWGVDHVHRFKAVEHMTFLVQLGPLTLTELSDPLPGFPYGQVRPVRRIGRAR